MKFNPTQLILMLGLTCALTVVNPNQAFAKECKGSIANKPDIVDTAVAGKFKTLVAAVKAAGLVDTLKGKGPFTVFAPTDKAFEKLPIGTIESLLKPENRSTLTAILTYHVVSGTVTADKVVKLKSAKTVNGQQVDIKVGKAGVMVDNAKVTATDIMCSNGVIHVIDSVIMPSTDDLVSTAVKAGTFKTLATAIKAAALIETLQGKGPFTVFAPTDEAFAKLPSGTIESLLKPENKDKLVAILTYHVVPNRVFSGDALKARSAKTVQGSNVNITATKNGAQVNNAKLVATDIDATNGVIHVIDTVLMPPKKSAKGPANARQMIELAIERGVPMYNHGNASGCAAVYEVAVHSVMAMSGDKLCSSSRSRMMKTLSQLEHTHSSKSRAWMLRHALDAAYVSLAN